MLQYQRGLELSNERHGTDDLHAMTCQSVYIYAIKISARALCGSCGSLNLPLAHCQWLEIGWQWEEQHPLMLSWSDQANACGVVLGHVRVRLHILISYILLEHPINYSNQLQMLIINQMVSIHWPTTSNTEPLQYSTVLCGVHNITRTHAHTSTRTWHCHTTQ